LLIEFVERSPASLTLNAPEADLTQGEFHATKSEWEPTSVKRMPFPTQEIPKANPLQRDALFPVARDWRTATAPWRTVPHVSPQAAHLLAHRSETHPIEGKLDPVIS
jgi:hypothetical protein